MRVLDVINTTRLPRSHHPTATAAPTTAVPTSTAVATVASAAAAEAP